jgi:hypothetical protein
VVPHRQAAVDDRRQHGAHVVPRRGVDPGRELCGRAASGSVVQQQVAVAVDDDQQALPHSARLRAWGRVGREEGRGAG